MATLPTIPSFSFGEVASLTKLNQLASAVTFVTQMPIVISLKRSASQSLTSGTATAVQWDVSEVDSDGTHSVNANTSKVFCQTQGYYRFHAVVAMTQTGTAAEYQAWFQQTTGVNNPAGSGVTQKFGAEASFSSASATDQTALSIRSLTPCLYVGDCVEVYCQVATTGVTVINNWRSSGNTDNAGNADGSSCLYGYYAFEGP